jgi:hypothetical protein
MARVRRNRVARPGGPSEPPLETRGVLTRVAGGTLLLVLAAGLIAAGAIAAGLGEREPLDLRIEGFAVEANAAAAEGSDPFAWAPERREFLERQAALGSSHVIYAMSPGGAVASAQRTAEYREEIDAAAERHGVDPGVLEAIVFLESAGRPHVSAGPTPEAASGLAQILPSTATELLGMRVDLPASIELTERIAKADSSQEAERLRTERASVDERFDPVKAIEGAASYLEIAAERFGAEDLAVESYHMGIGNLESVIRAYLGESGERPIGELVDGAGLSYAQLYFDSSPSRHSEAHAELTAFGDESADYLWKVRASEEIMRAWRADRDALAGIAELATAKATLEEVFHPENETEVFDDPGELEGAIRDAELVPLPESPDLGWVPSRHVGELAEELDQVPELYRALRPEALATLSYLAGRVQEESGATAPLRISSAVRDREYQEMLTASNPEATHEYSLHTTGWSFDILREYESGAQATAFQFVLDRLSALALIDYAVEPGAIHVTVSDLGGELVEPGG